MKKIKYMKLDIKNKAILMVNFVLILIMNKLINLFLIWRIKFKIIDCDFLKLYLCITFIFVF